MKTTKGRVFLFISVITLASGLTWALKAQQVPEKEITLKLTRGEAEVLYSLIDDAAVAGQVRKPLLRKIEVAYSVAFPQQPQPQPKDTTTKTKKN